MSVSLIKQKTQALPGFWKVVRAVQYYTKPALINVLRAPFLVIVLIALQERRSFT
jgi:hypothetical protein